MNKHNTSKRYIIKNKHTRNEKLSNNIQNHKIKENNKDYSRSKKDYKTNEELINTKRSIKGNHKKYVWKTKSTKKLNCKKEIKKQRKSTREDISNKENKIRSRKLNRTKTKKEKRTKISIGNKIKTNQKINVENKTNKRNRLNKSIKTNKEKKRNSKKEGIKLNIIRREKTSNRILHQKITRNNYKEKMR